jgi:hypothetical protein
MMKHMHATAQNPHGKHAMARTVSAQRLALEVGVGVDVFVLFELLLCLLSGCVVYCMVSWERAGSSLAVVGGGNDNDMVGRAYLGSVNAKVDYLERNSSV